VRGSSRVLQADDVAGLCEADEGRICLFAEIGYLQALRETKTAAVVTKAQARKTNLARPGE
jgi:hypothetical protein